MGQLGTHVGISHGIVPWWYARDLPTSQRNLRSLKQALYTPHFAPTRLIARPEHKYSMGLQNEHANQRRDGTTAAQGLATDEAVRRHDARHHVENHVSQERGHRH